MYIVYCILYIVYCILYIVYCILYTVYCIFVTVETNCRNKQLQVKKSKERKKNKIIQYISSS